MWTTLALTAALQLTPSQPGALALENDRFTYGYFGAARKDASFLPGDVVVLAFEATGVKLSPAGKASCSVALELFDNAGKSLYKQMPRNQQASCSLGGGNLHSMATIPLPAEQGPGDYTIKLTFQDTVAGAGKSLERKIKILPPSFGLVHVSTAADPEGKVPKGPLGVVGEPIYVKFAAVGFQRDAAKKQPQVEFTLKVLDDKGAPTVTQPLSGTAAGDIPEQFIPAQFGLTLNRPGSYTVELTATDKVGGKTSSVSFPLKVIAQ